MMFLHEGWEEYVYGQEEAFLQRPIDFKSDVSEEIGGFIEEVVRGVYNSIPVKKIHELPELQIISGIFLCKIQVFLGRLL